MCMGKFGRPTRPVDPEVEAAILDRPRARELAREDDFPTLADLRRRFGATMPEEEFLLRAVMPGDQVDAMLGAGSGRTGYSPEMAPVLALLKKLAERPAARDLVVERPGFRLALHAGPALTEFNPALTERVLATRGVIFDMDGTLVLGDAKSGGHKPLPGAIELLRLLRRREIPFRIFTNGTFKTPRPTPRACAMPASTSATAR